MRPLDFLGRIKIKLGMVILLAVLAAFVVNEVGINAGYSRDVRIAVAAAFALVLVQLLARGMTKPLREMAAAAQTIAKGRYGLRVTASSRDEVGELARAFNAMAADLGEVDRQRRELVANVSHELRTPITALRAVLENVVDGVSDPDPGTLGTALAQTERLSRLVAQLLDLSRLESGARRIELEDVELRQLGEQALREAVLAREGVTARCEIPEGLSLRADPDLLAQVLANLLDNAVRHSPDGGVVTLAASGRDDGVRLRVSDQGPGIPAEDRVRAFERFSRLDAGRAADEGGAGLGLAITKEIVELHGGSIRVEDGIGCHVVVDLPGRIMMSTSPPSGAGSGPSAPRAGRAPEAPVPSAPRAKAASPDRAPRAPQPPETVPTSHPGVESGSDEVPEAGESAGIHGPSDAHPAPGGDTAGDVREGSEARQPSASAEAAEGAGASGTREVPVAVPSAVPGTAGASGTREVPVVVPSAAPSSAVPGTAGPPKPPFPSTPLLAPGGGQREPERNWVGAIIGLFLGGVAGLLGAVVVGIAVAPASTALAALAAVAVLGIGGFIGTVIGATTPTNDVWTGQTALPHRPPAQGPGAPATALSAAGDTSRREAPVSAVGDTSRREAPVSAAGSEPRREVPVPAGSAAQPRQAPGASGEPTAAPGPGGPETAGKPGGPEAYQAPPILPRPELPDTPRWVLPASAAVGVLAAVVVPYSRAGLGLVLVAVAMGLAAIPAVRGRVTPWSAGLGAVAYGLVAMAMFRDADWLVGLLLLAGFLMAALALSGAGRGWLGVLRGGASVVVGLVPVPWFLSAPLKGLVARRKLVPTLLGGGLTLVLLVVFGALFASADAVFAEAVERVLTAQDWAESLPQRILLFAVFAVVVASAVLVGLRPVAEPASPDLRITVGRGLWVTPLIALNLLFATFVAMQLTVLFGSTRWLVSATGLTYAEYARSGFFQLVIVSVFVLAIVAAASGAVELRGFDRWLMAGLLGLLCALTLVILFSALHRLDLYVDAYGFSRLRASVWAAIWWLAGVFGLVLVAGAVRLAGRGHGRWLPRTLVVMTGASLLAFGVWNPDLRVAETQIAVRGVDMLDLEYLGELGAEAVPALDRLPEPARSCALRDVISINDLHETDPWNGWNLARSQARELLERRPVIQDVACVPTTSQQEIPD
ncbi:hypothetical protein GCM10010517_26060 [Streptosporangium fragile]|uniref:Signal transduction histidine-protein kinase/phosphatase MprB n=1 Tax=Streptosporangium fragile TaxID=46186 RepID=A0ABN3VW12_9ACTN